MNRTPPVAVLNQLRREVGFGCPVPGCGNPYLYWHHFDPPWREHEHHDPEGMIGLCSEHHAKADAGAFTKEQLLNLKQQGAERAVKVKGGFDWMRRDLLAVVGGNFYHETPVVFQFRGDRVIWFNRDEEGYLLLNVRMLTVSQEPRMTIEVNFWLASGDPESLECPPSGRLLEVKYPNGDTLKVEFFELDSAAAASTRYPGARSEEWPVSFPLVAVEIRERVADTGIEFGPRETKLGGVVMRDAVGLAIG